MKSKIFDFEALGAHLNVLESSQGLPDGATCMQVSSEMPSAAAQYDESPSPGPVRSSMRVQFTNLAYPEQRSIDLDRPVTSHLVEAICHVHGVGTVTADRDRYRMTVTRGELFSWSEVGPRVVAVIEDVFNAKAEVKRVCHFKDVDSDTWGV